MNQIELQTQVLGLLEHFSGIEPLKELVWSKLNYDRVNKPASRRVWPDGTRSVLADDPTLLAAGGQNGDFKILYSRLAKDRLSLSDERLVTSQLLKDYPYSLFVFSDRSQTNWHFLNVKLADDQQRRRLYRRVTVGPFERLRTASQIISQLDFEAITPTLFGVSPLLIQEKHDQAFDVEKVQKQFFSTFAFLYHALAEDIAAAPGLSSVAAQNAQLLLDRMLFLYFIQKKGWLNQQPDYLYQRFKEHLQRNPSGSTYYTEVLRPLFTCLANKDVSLSSVGDVPFLNGGLFEEIEGKSQAERVAASRIDIRNSTFKRLFEDLLERFNFTVTEDTPLDVEVAIDPEMLGKVFESLILQLEKEPTRDLRKLTGSYYTPRPIVHMMCVEALRHYLMAASSGQGIDVTEERVTALLNLPPAEQLDEHGLEQLRSLFSAAEANAFRDLVLNCRICDPAVGSGAFPVGMLHEMVTTAAKLDTRLHGPQVTTGQNYFYELKRQIIENCLYGVDVQEQAVRLCELRLWLSLIVDYQLDSTKPFSVSIKHVPSLPNLSYRIMQGDSLLERLFGHTVQLDRMSKDQRTSQIIDSIGADKHAYFHESSTAEKRRLELKILTKQVELAERLVETKKAALTSHNLSLFGESKADAKLRDLRERQETQLAELIDRIKKAESELKRATAGALKAVDRGGLDTLRRKVFEVQGAPTFIWHMDFAEVFRDRGGFDVVIGNPPYYNVETLGKGSEVVQALQLHYPEIWMDKSDILFYFICLGTRIQNQNGTLVFITSRSYIEANKAENLREYLAKGSMPQALIDFRGYRVFEEAGIATSILMTSGPRQQREKTNGNLRVLQVGHWLKGKDALAEALESSLQQAEKVSSGSLRSFSVDRQTLGRAPWNFADPTVQTLFDRLDRCGKPLKSVARELGSGMQSGRNRIFGVTRDTVTEYGLEAKHLRQYASNSDIEPFQIHSRDKFLIFLEDLSSFSKVPPNIARYLKQREDDLKKRAACQRGNCRWWQYTWPLHKEFYGETDRIICPYRAAANRFAFDVRDEFLTLNDTTILFVDRSSPISAFAIEAILNSRLLTFRYRGIGKLTGQNSWEYFDYGLARLPIWLPDSDQERDLCGQLHKLAKAAHASERRRSEAIQEIDELVYRLYTVTHDERKVIDAEMEWSSFAVLESAETVDSIEEA